MTEPRSLKTLGHGDMLVGPRARLVPLMPEHYRDLYDVALEPEVARRWEPSSYGGSFEGWMHRLTDGVLCQYGVKLRRSNRQVDGLVRCYGANFRHGTAQVSVFMSTRTHTTGVGLEALALLIDFIFERYPLRKLYAETIEYNFAQFAGGVGKYFEIEGHMKGHEIHDGVPWDNYLLAITRELWMANGKDAVARARAVGQRLRSRAAQRKIEAAE